ncbi:MAG TPA: acylphosphatase [Gemmatimonadales bacterium]|nr:acylphosphatase [Gemmatimonadales bacterium]HRZ10206.1 acylphosphatase [Gemmatimonadales bacterium]
MKRIRFVVTGRVQGVGFRWFVKAEARPLGLTGWVRNREDGAVEGEVEGRDDALEALIPCLEEGPSSAIVTNVKISEISDDGPHYKQFEIR